MPTGTGTGSGAGEPATEAGYAGRINEVELPEPVLEAVREYEAGGGERDRFVWKWIYSLLPEFTLSSVPERYADTVRTHKTLFTVFVTLLDDVAERDGGSRSFDRIRRVVREPGSQPGAKAGTGVDSELVAFAGRLWTAVRDGLARAPRHEEFEELFRYDFRQAMNAMEYTRLLNERPAMANLNGARHYDSHNMVLFPYAGIDLMHSPGFDLADLGVLRELIWDLQRMARIGNWLTTWERELGEGDYSAGVVVYALQHDLVDREQLERAGAGSRKQRRDGPSAADRIKSHHVEQLFVAEWEQLRRKVIDRGLEADSLDLEAFVDGMETVMDHHLASEGYK